MRQSNLSVCLHWGGGGAVGLFLCVCGSWCTPVRGQRRAKLKGRGTWGGLATTDGVDSLVMDSSRTNFENFNLNDLSADPSYDFLNKIKQSSDEKFSFFTSDEDLNSPYNAFNFNCNYSSIESCILGNNKLTILSINIQSLNAKFNELKDLIYEMSSSGPIPDIICLQELWQIHSDFSFSLHGYQPLQFRLRADGVRGGGVGIFVRLGINFNVEPQFSIFHDRILESLIIQVTVNDKKCT